MPPTVTNVSTREEDSMNNEASLSGRQIIGLIYPPPEIRTIVDKTANFVARNGIDFENKIREKEANNHRFNFLSATDPYNAYYQSKVRELQDGKSSVESSLMRAQVVPEAVKEAVKKVEFIPTRPPPPFEYTADPTTINAFDLDLVKLTALFVARNGRPFLTQLMNREIRNYQFDFLKPQHSNFPYFTKLVEQYTKVAIPAKNIVTDLQEERSNRKKLLDDIKYRVNWEKHQKSLKDKEAAEAERERLAYASIDWHDFVVVQTVDFQPGDIANLPGLCTPKDVGARILLEAREEQARTTAQPVEMDMEESDEEPEEETEQEPETAPESVHLPSEMTQPAPLPPTKQNVTIREFDPRKTVPTKKPNEKWLVSPLTGEWIPSDKLEEHVRYNTMDSQYKEERERGLAERTNEEPVYAPGAEVGKNLASFAKRRTDIFGVGEQGAQQTMIGQTLGEEELIGQGVAQQNPPTTRDKPNVIPLPDQVPPPSANVPPLAPPRPGIVPASTLPPLPPAAAGMPPLPPAAVPPRGVIPSAPIARPPVPMPPPSMEGPPPAKKAKTEEDLIPEHEWLSKVPATLDIMLQLPQASEWSMDGSIVAFQVQASHPVSQLKTMIQDKYSMPSGKQKLSFENMFMKDANTFAFYNVINKALVVLAPKERGGRKK